MSGEIDIKSQNNLWDKIGRDLVNEHMTKDVVSNAYKAAFQTITTKGKNKLRDETPEHTGWLRASAGKKVDRMPNRLSVYGLVGYLRPNYNKTQFFYVLGTKKPRRIKGSGIPVPVGEDLYRSTKNRGIMPKAKPDPFELVKSAVASAAVGLAVERIQKIKDNAENKMQSKYGNAWRDL
jgi:hypothetical protein